MLSSRSIDPPPTLPRLGLQNTNRTTRAAFAAAARPEPASRHTTRIRLISIAKQGQWRLAQPGIGFERYQT
jgi:hypothetical protein